MHKKHLSGPLRFKKLVSSLLISQFICPPNLVAMIRGEEEEDSRNQTYQVYTYRQRIFEGSFQGNPVFFEEHVADSDGSCGFHVLGLGRDLVRDHLLRVADQGAIRELIAPEIKAAFKANELPNSLKETEKYREIWTKLEENRFPDELETALSAYALEQNTYERFIGDAFSGATWLTYIRQNQHGERATGILDAIAQIGNKKVYIWQQSIPESQTLELVFESRNETSDHVHMFHTNNGTHFNLLSLHDQRPTGTPEASARSSFNSQPREESEAQDNEEAIDIFADYLEISRSDFSEKASVAQIRTRGTTYFIDLNQNEVGSIAGLWAANPLNRVDFGGRRLESRRIDLLTEPHGISGYLNTRTLEKCLWGFNPEIADLWFVVPPDGKTYALEVRSIGLQDRPLNKLTDGVSLDKASVSRAFINSLLFNPQQGTEDHFRVSAHGEGFALSSSRAFEDINPLPIVRLESGKHKVLTRNALYLKEDLLNQPLDESVKNFLSAFIPEVYIAQWLIALHKEDSHIRDIAAFHDPKLMETFQNHPTEENSKKIMAEMDARAQLLADGGFPVHLRKGSVASVFHTLNRLKLFIRENSSATHRDLIQSFDPMTALFYNLLGAEALKGGILEERIGQSKPFPDMPTLTVEMVLKSHPQETRQQGISTASEALNDFLEQTFWRALDKKTPSLDFLNTFSKWALSNEIPSELINFSDQEAAWSNLRILLGSKDASLETFSFAKKIGFDLHRKHEGKTLLREAVESFDLDRILHLCDLISEEEIAQAEGTSVLDLLVAKRKQNLKIQKIIDQLIRKGHGGSLQNPETFLEWYKEIVQQKIVQQTTEAPFEDMFRLLAGQNQKFSWLATLEDVFPAFNISEDEIRSGLTEMLQENLPEEDRIIWNFLTEKIRGATDEQQKNKFRDYFKRPLISRSIEFLKEQWISKKLDPVLFLGLMDDETTDEKIKRLESYLSNNAVISPIDWTRYDGLDQDSRLQKLLEFTRRLKRFTSTIDDALVNLKVPPLSVENISKDEKLEEFLKRSGQDDFPSLLRARITTLEDAYYALSWHFKKERFAEGATSGHRRIPSFIVSQLWGEDGIFKRGQFDGRRAVAMVSNPEGLLGKQGALFVKKLPEFPGLEAAAQLAVFDLFGQGVPYSDLFNISGIPYLISQGFVHPNKALAGNLREIKKREPESVVVLEEELSRLDQRSFSETFLTSLILNPEDAKPDNFVLAPTPGGVLRLISIDNDHILAPIQGDPEIKKQQMQSRLTQVYSYLFSMQKQRNNFPKGGPMDWPIDQKAVDLFLRQDPMQFTKKWLTALVELSKRYDGLFREESATYFAKNHDSFMRIILNRKMVNGFYDNFLRAQEALREYVDAQKRPTHKQLLAKVNPLVAERASNSSLNHASMASSSPRAMTTTLGYRTFDDVFRSARTLESQLKFLPEQIETIERALKEIRNSYQQATKINATADATMVHKGHINKFNDLLNLDDENALLSSFQITQFLKEADFKSLSLSNPEDNVIVKSLLSRLKNSTNPLSRIILRNLKQFKDEDVASALGQPGFQLPNLIHLEIPGCTSINSALITRISREATHLRFLDLSGIPLGRKFEVLSDQNNPLFPSLEKLILENMPGLKTLCLTLPTLEFLSLKGSQNLSEITLNCPQITDLNLRDVPNVTDDMLEILLGSFKNKEAIRLHLSGTKVTWPELRERFPTCAPELAKRLKELSLAELREGKIFQIEGLGTQSRYIDGIGWFLGNLALGGVVIVAGPVGWVTWVSMLAGNVVFSLAKSVYNNKYRKAMQDNADGNLVNRIPSVSVEEASYLSGLTEEEILERQSKRAKIFLDKARAADLAAKEAYKKENTQKTAENLEIASNNLAKAEETLNAVWAAQKSLEKAKALPESGRTKVAFDASQASRQLTHKKRKKKEAPFLAEVAIEATVKATAAKAGEEIAKTTTTEATKTVGETVIKTTTEEIAKTATTESTKTLAETTIKATGEEIAKAAAQVKAHIVNHAIPQALKDAATPVATEKISQSGMKESLAIIGPRVATAMAQETLTMLISAYELIAEERRRDAIARGFLGSVLAHGLKDNQTLEELRIPKAQLGNEGLLSLALALKSHPRITYLDLSRCGFGDKGIGECGEGDEGGKGLACALRLQKTLRSVNLSGNAISDAGAQELLLALGQNQSIIELNLEQNYTYTVFKKKIKDTTLQKIKKKLIQNADQNRTEGIFRGSLEETTFEFQVVRRPDNSGSFGLGALGIDKFTAIRLLFDQIQNDTLAKEFIEKELTAGREEAESPAVPAALKASIKKIILQKDPPLTLKKGGILEALARSMEATFRFWVPKEGQGNSLKHVCTLGNSSAVRDFLISRGQEIFSGARSLEIHTHNQDNLAPSVQLTAQDVERRKIRYGLSIDGGGMRGLIPAQMLSLIEEKAKAYKPTFKAREFFDYVGGTSIGGILALGLTVPKSNGEFLSSQELQNFFSVHGKEIFGQKSGLGYLFALYKSGPLEALLKRIFGEESTLERASKPVLITTVDATASPYKASVFNSLAPAHKSWPVWQIGRATAAAPKFFDAPVFRSPSGSKTYTFYDGGLWANNPSSLLFDSISNVYSVEKPTEDIRILSLGTGETLGTYAPPSMGWGGGLPIAEGLILGGIDLAMHATHEGMRQKLGANYRRLQPTIDINVAMDAHSESVLAAYEQSASSMRPDIEKVVEEWIRPALEEN